MLLIVHCWVGKLINIIIFFLSCLFLSLVLSSSFSSPNGTKKQTLKSLFKFQSWCTISPSPRISRSSPISKLFKFEDKFNQWEFQKCFARNPPNLRIRKSKCHLIITNKEILALMHEERTWESKLQFRTKESPHLVSFVPNTFSDKLMKAIREKKGGAQQRLHQKCGRRRKEGDGE